MSRENFTVHQYQQLHDMLRLVNEALTQMMVVVSGRREDLSTAPSLEIEHDINVLRDELKNESVGEVNANEYSYAVSTFYIDVVNDCEKLGDYVMNVVEARLGKRNIIFRGLQVNLDKKTVSIDGIPVNLTRIEFELLRELLSAHGQIRSRQQLIDTVWDGTIVTDRTVDVHIVRLRKKLGSYSEHIANRPGLGYYFDENYTFKE
jgi:phosphate:Na+ symporter